MFKLKNNSLRIGVDRFTDPDLIFKRGVTERIIDPRYGLLKFGPYDYNISQQAFDEINIEVVCFKMGDYPKDIHKLLNMLENKDGIKMKSKYKSYANYPYIGFLNIYKANLNIADSKEYIYVTKDEIDEIKKSSKKGFNNFITEFRNLYGQKILDAAEKNGQSNTIVCVHLPEILDRILMKIRKPRDFIGIDLRSIIKAISVEKRIKTQVLKENSIRPNDYVDVLWNLSLAIYVKAGGVPWKLKELLPASMFIGIRHGIRKDENGQTIAIGVAEIVNKYGEHIDVAAIDFSEEDIVNAPEFFNKRPYLTEKGMEKLISKAVSEYSDKLKSVVIHRTLDFKEEEIEGIKKALSSVKNVDLLHIMENTDVRLFSNLHPKRGTFIYDKENNMRGWLFTTGWIEAENTYPGVGTPRPLELIKYGGKKSINKLAYEVLALTKMNWNSVRPMMREPITIKYSKKVVDVIKAGLKPGFHKIDIRYYF